MPSNKPKSDEKMYTGGSKNFDERTGKYKNGSAKQKCDTITAKEKAKTGSEEKKMTMKERMAKLREMRGSKTKAKKSPAQKRGTITAREKARLERAKKAKMKKPTVRKKK